MYLWCQALFSWSFLSNFELELEVGFNECFKHPIFHSFISFLNWTNVLKFKFLNKMWTSLFIWNYLSLQVFENAFFKEKQSSLLSHIVLTVGLVVLTLALSTRTDCLSIVLELNVSFFKKFLLITSLSNNYVKYY